MERKHLSSVSLLIKLGVYYCSSVVRRAGSTWKVGISRGALQLQEPLFVACTAELKLCTFSGKCGNYGVIAHIKTDSNNLPHLHSQDSV
jgi:hypothetical protein